MSNLSRNDKQVMDKLNVDFVKDRAEPTKQPSRYAELNSVDDLDVDEMKPEVKKEAVLKLNFGKFKEKPTFDNNLIGGGLLSTENPENPDHLSEYRLYLQNGNMEFFQVYNDKVFGFINRQTFEDSFKLDADWKVRFYALEEIYIQLCGLPQMKNDQLWNMNKFLYVQFNCGIKIEFLDKEKYQRQMKLSLKDFRDGFDAVIYIDQIEGQSKGIKYRRPLQKIYNPKTEAYSVVADFPLGRRESINPTKIDVVLLLISQRVISYRSGLLLEPIIRLLCLETVAVRRLAFDLLAKIQAQYRSKKKTLFQLYILALKYPNWLLRCAILNLIVLGLARDRHGEPLDIQPKDLILAVAVLLDDDAMKVKDAAVDALVIIGRTWEERLLQEALLDIVEPKVVDYVIDRIDDQKYDPVGKIDKVNADTPSAKENDFVKEIIEKERKFNKIMGIQDDLPMPELSAEPGEKSVVGIRINKGDESSIRSSVGRSRGESPLKAMKDSIDVSLSLQNRSVDSKSNNSGTNRSKLLPAAEKPKKGEMLIIEGKVPRSPLRLNKFQQSMKKEPGLNERLKYAKQNVYKSMDVGEGPKYEGKDNGLVLEEPKKKLTPEQMMENVFNEYMSERQQYDGKFNPTDQDHDRQNYDQYKKIFDVPKDADAFEKYMKKAEQQKLKENNEKLYKKPQEEVDDPVPYIDFEHLRPLKDPEQFIKEFHKLTEGSNF